MAKIEHGVKPDIFQIDGCVTDPSKLKDSTQPMNQMESWVL